MSRLACPTCGAPLLGFTPTGPDAGSPSNQALRRGEREPGENDVAVCDRCAALNIFGPDGPRSLSDAEAAELLAPATLAQANFAQGFIRIANRSKN